MFRQRQKINFMPSSSSSLPATTYDEDGHSSSSFVSGHEALPAIENFRLKNLLKSGVPLEEVNTKVIDSGVVDLPNLSTSKNKVIEKSIDNLTEKVDEKPTEISTTTSQIKEN